jgi:hypothetical protein
VFSWPRQMEQMAKAYDTFGHAMRERALKVMILND